MSMILLWRNAFQIAGREQFINEIQSSEFCLHPAGDMPPSYCIFYVLSICIPVIARVNYSVRTSDGRTVRFKLRYRGSVPDMTHFHLNSAQNNFSIASKNIKLPFEGTVDYTDFTIFVPVYSTWLAGWLFKELYQPSEGSVLKAKCLVFNICFQYDNRNPGGVGAFSSDGAGNNKVRKANQKLPMIKVAITR